ncbi:serine proteinase stubble isoform X2 [Cylas formicarius]|nr:serine proteinase stubble isoform X2 [Cylas formicarius]
MLWMAVLGAILVWYTVPCTCRGSLQRTPGFQINPKPCMVDGQEGTCMFVYECIKSEGYHIGMCVDAFMFGSCCAHNLTANSVTSYEAQAKPQVLYTAPSQSSTVTNKPVVASFSQFASSITKPPSRPQTNQRRNETAVTARPALVAASMGVRPSSSRQPTQPPRHSIRPMSTDAFSASNSISLAHHPRPDRQTTTEAGFITSITEQISVHQQNSPGNNWQLTPESELSNRIKKPSTFKPKPNKPSKKPLPNNSKNPTKYPAQKPTKSTTERGPTEIMKPIMSTLGLGHNGLDLLEDTSTNPLNNTRIAKVGCGTPQMFTQAKTRIVGGKNANFGRWPWQVSVRRTSFFGFSSTHRCGGAILNENWIATAGHCVDDLLTSQIRIRVGEYDFSSVQEELPYVERAVAKKVVHPKYNFFTYEYDLALVQLDKHLDFAPHISPICLPPSDDLLIGENATVTGWGRLSEGGTLPSVLQEVQVPIVSNDRCKSMFLRAGRHEFIPDIFLCAGHEGGGQDSCQGDSGGPLQVKGKNGRYFLAGIISWGIGCAEANLPGVCTRISKFVPWILKNVT